MKTYRCSSKFIFPERQVAHPAHEHDGDVVRFIVETCGGDAGCEPVGAAAEGVGEEDEGVLGWEGEVGFEGRRGAVAM